MSIIKNALIFPPYILAQALLNVVKSRIYAVCLATTIAIVYVSINLRISEPGPIGLALYLLSWLPIIFTLAVTTSVMATDRYCELNNRPFEMKWFRIFGISFRKTCIIFSYGLSFYLVIMLSLFALDTLVFDYAIADAGRAVKTNGASDPNFIGETVIGIISYLNASLGLYAGGFLVAVAGYFSILRENRLRPALCMNTPIFTYCLMVGVPLHYLHSAGVNTDIMYSIFAAIAGSTLVTFQLNLVRKYDGRLGSVDKAKASYQ